MNPAQHSPAAILASERELAHQLQQCLQQEQDELVRADVAALAQTAGRKAGIVDQMNSLAQARMQAVAAAGQCHFKLELTFGKGSPDGYERDMIFVNGQYPVPTLDIQQDDWVEIEVLNNMPFNSSIHYHGTCN